MTLSFLRGMALLGVFLSVLIATIHVAGLPTPAGRWSGLRGLKRSRALSRYPAWRMVEPLLRWSAARIGPLLPASTQRRVDVDLARAGDPLGLNPAELIVLSVLVGCLGAGFGATYAALASRSALYAVFCAIIALGYPVARVQSLVTGRAEAIRRGLPPSIDLLCLGLSAGLDLPGALSQVVEKSVQKDDPLIEELHVVLRELALGKTRREALSTFAARNPVASVKELVAACIQAEEEGSSLADVLTIQAKVSRERRSALAEEAASKAALKLLVPMGLVFMSVFILIGGPLGLELMEELIHVGR